MTKQEKKERIELEREATMSILRTLKSLDVFTTVDKLDISRDEIDENSPPAGILTLFDLIIKGTNQFLYFDKQAVNGKQTGHSLAEKHRVLYIGTFNPKTGEVLTWGK